MPGDLLIRWTIWLSMMAYFAFLLTLIRPSVCSWEARRGIWTLSWLLFLGHFIFAYHFYHHWSHGHAVADTASKTEMVIGWRFGHGIYFSYLFLGTWLTDVLWMWIAATSYKSRAKEIGCLIHSFLFFIAINGTAIFEAGVTRWATIVCCGVLAVAFAYGRHGNG